MEKDESSLSVAEEGPANAKSKLPQDENASIIWVKVVEGRNLESRGMRPEMLRVSSRNPTFYCGVEVEDTINQQTLASFRTDKSRARNPTWDQEFTYTFTPSEGLCLAGMVLRVTCHLASHVHDSFCGSLTIPLKSAEESKFIDSWFLLAGTKKELNPVRGELHLRIKVAGVVQEAKDKDPIKGEDDDVVEALVPVPPVEDRRQRLFELHSLTDIPMFENVLKHKHKDWMDTFKGQVGNYSKGIENWREEKGLDIPLGERSRSPRGWTSDWRSFAEESDDITAHLNESLDDSIITMENHMKELDTALPRYFVMRKTFSERARQALLEAPSHLVDQLPGEMLPVPQRDIRDGTPLGQKSPRSPRLAKSPTDVDMKSSYPNRSDKPNGLKLSSSTPEVMTRSPSSKRRLDPALGSPFSPNRTTGSASRTNKPISPAAKSPQTPQKTLRPEQSPAKPASPASRSPQTPSRSSSSTTSPQPYQPAKTATPSSSPGATPFNPTPPRPRATRQDSPVKSASPAPLRTPPSPTMLKSAPQKAEFPLTPLLMIFVVALLLYFAQHWLG